MRGRAPWPERITFFWFCVIVVCGAIGIAMNLFQWMRETYVTHPIAGNWVIGIAAVYAALLTYRIRTVGWRVVWHGDPNKKRNR